MCIRDRPTRELIGFLENRDERTTLHSGIAEIHAFLPMSTYIYINMHASHPAANFSTRMGEIEYLAQIQDSETLYNEMKEIQYGPIERMIFFEDKRVDYYSVYLHLDNFPNGIKEKEIRFSKALFDSEFFDTIYTNDQYRVIEPR